DPTGGAYPVEDEHGPTVATGGGDRRGVGEGTGAGVHMGDRDQRRRRPTGAGGDNRLGLDPAAPLAADSGDRHALSLGDLLETVAEVAVAADHDPVTGTGVVDHRRLHGQGPRTGDDVDPSGRTAADTRTDAVLHATHRR